MDQNQTDIQSSSPPRAGGAGPGALLYTVEADRKRVGLEMVIRAAVSILAVLLASDTAQAVRIAVAAVLICFTVWPVRHMHDQMELHQNGVVYRGKFCPVGPQTRAVWVGRRIGFLPSTFLELSGCKRRIDVSFMKDAEKLFARAYSSVVF